MNDEELAWDYRIFKRLALLALVGLVIEVSGWFKVIYLLRHFFPDARKTGRYA